jgi:hypothetical protein
MELGSTSVQGSCRSVMLRDRGYNQFLCRRDSNEVGI